MARGQTCTEGLVDNWLTEVGLGYATQNFQMAGIESPRSMAELKVEYFEALGVKKPGDRKKLFFLVQTVKERLANGGDDEEEYEATENASHEDDESSSGGTIPSPILTDENKDGSYSEEFASITASENAPSLKSRENAHLAAGASGSRKHGVHSNSINNNNCPHPSSRESRRVETDSEVLMSVDTNEYMDPISPVTLSSPLSMEGVEAYSKSKQLNTKCINNKPGNHGSARQQNYGRKPSDMYSFDEESATGNSYQGDYDELDDYLGSDRGSLATNNSKKNTGMHTSIPSTAGSRTRRSNIYSRSATKNIDASRDDELDECLGTDETSNRNTTTPKTVTTIGNRSHPGSFSSRPTVKKTNTSRYLSGVAPTTSVSTDNFDDRSIRSETSELSTSLHSLSSLGSSASNIVGVRRKSRASIGSCSSSRSGISLSRLDENSNRNNVGSRIKISSQVKDSKLEIQTSIPSRTGKKRLSTIPSQKIAPISPLAGLSSSQLEESIVSRSGIAGARKPAPNSRRKSLGSNSVSRPGSADSSESKNSLTFRDRNVDLDSSFGSTSSRRSLSSNASKGSTGFVRSHAKSGGGSTASLTRPSSRSSMDGSQRSGKLKNSSGVSKLPSAQGRRQLKSPPRSGLSQSSTRGKALSPIRTPRSQLALPSVRSPYSQRSLSPVRSPPVKPSSPIRAGIQGRSLSPVRSPTRGASPNGKFRERSVSPIGRSNRSVSPKSPSGGTRNKSPINSGAVFVHGATEDNSWNTQIGRLRDSFEQEHRAFMTGREAYREDEEYEMRIRVIVRKRPMSKSESLEKGGVDAIHPLDYEDHGRILVYQPKTKLDLTKEVETTSFAFDNVFNEKSNNMEIYSRAVQNLIPGVFRGKWASVFAYGQTGSGKTVSLFVNYVVRIQFHDRFLIFSFS